MNAHNRRCGDCQLCCTLVPIKEPDFVKLANERCQHQKYGCGCAIYATRPMPCRLWSCKWLVDPGTLAMQRPDHSHYVVDLMIDHVLVNKQPINAIQVWCDPAHPDAHTDPALRDYLDKLGKQEAAVSIVRYSSHEGFVLFPPSLTPDGKWREVWTNPITREEVNERLAQQRSRP